MCHPNGGIQIRQRTLSCAGNKQFKIAAVREPRRCETRIGQLPAQQADQFFDVQDSNGASDEDDHRHRSKAAVEFAAQVANTAGLQALAGLGAGYLGNIAGD